MIAPTPAALAAMAAVVCPEDGGEHPLEWSEPYTPAVAPRTGPGATPGPKAALRALSDRTARFLTPRRTK